MVKSDKDQALSLHKSSSVKNETVQDIATAIREKNKFGISKRREEVGSNLMAFGNIAGGALIFGQAFGGFDFDTQTAIAGVLLFVVLYFVAFVLMKGER